MRNDHRTARATWRALALAGALAGASSAHAIDLFGDAQKESACRALAVVRGLPAPALLAMHGQADAFDLLRARQAELAVIRQENRLGGSIGAVLGRIDGLATRLIAMREPVLAANRAIDELSRRAASQLDLAETAESLMLQEGAGPAEIAAIGQLVMLTQRIGKSGREFLRLEGLDPEAVFLLGKDLNTSQVIVTGLMNGNAELRLPGKGSAARKAALAKLAADFALGRQTSSEILKHLQEIVAARDAQAAIAADALGVDRALTPACMGR